MKRYPKYKDSGVEWIGEIAEGWDAGKLKYRITRNDGGAWGDDFDDKGVIVLRSTEITLDGNWKIEEPARRSLNKIEINKTVLRKGDLLITKSSGSEKHIGKTALVTEAVESLNACFSNFMQRIRPNKNQDSRYLDYILNSDLARGQYNYLSQTTTGLANLSAEIIGSIQIPFLLFHEQQSIANYLDRKTRQIDTLIEKKQKLIDLLKEERTAIINQAVTKGLNPNVKMKDSGIEWLGEIPERWAITHIKYIGAKHRDAIVDGPFGSSVNVQTDYVDKGIPVIRTINISNTGFVENGLSFIRNEKFEQLSRHAVYPNDVLLSKVGTIGNTCLFPPHIPKGMLSTTGSCKITTDKNLMIPKYLVYLFQSMKEHFMLLASSNVQPFLNMGTIRNISIPLLPIEDQKIIVENIEMETGKIDNTIEKIEKKIDLLKEYRTALISEVVTGKIDVRDIGKQED